MVDYTRATGSTGTMMIRDTGTVVEYWIRASAPTYDNNMPWSYVANGSTSGTFSFEYSNSGNWMKVFSFNVTYDQVVQFRLGATGTGGLGGPTTLSADIERSSYPEAPSSVRFTNVTDTTLTASFTDGNNNGAAITTRQIGYGTSSAAPTNFANSDGTTAMVGFTPALTYFFWARTQNAKGWSHWSARSGLKMPTVPAAPSVPTFTNILYNSVTANFVGSSNNGGSGVLEYQLHYGFAPTADNYFQTYNGPTTVNMEPGETFYFKSRARNEHGWSAFSAISSITLIAGARINVNGVWKNAVPYINVNGVWKLARPWGKIHGVWKETG